MSQNAPAGAEGQHSVPDVAIPGVGTAFGPPDLYTFYDEKPLISGGNHGTGTPDCIAMAENYDVNDKTVAVFNDQFGLPPLILTRVLVDGTIPVWMRIIARRFSTSNGPMRSPRIRPIYFYIGDFLTTSRGRSRTIFVG